MLKSKCTFKMHSLSFFVGSILVHLKLIQLVTPFFFCRGKAGCCGGFYIFQIKQKESAD